MRTLTLLWAGWLIGSMCSSANGQNAIAKEGVAVVEGTVIGVPGLCSFGSEMPLSNHGKPVAGAVVSVAVPAIDMRQIRMKPEHKRFETVTDAAGRYKLVVPARERNMRVSIDAYAPGFRSFAGSDMGGGGQKLVVLNPGGTVAFDITLTKALYVAGLVVDSTGKHIAGVDITAMIQKPNAYGYITELLSGANGRFEIFDFPLAGTANGRGTIVFEHPDFRRTEIDDVYVLSDAKRKDLRVVMETGRTVSGRILAQNGEAFAGLLVEANFDNVKERKAALTNEDGLFSLRGLPQKRCTLVVHAIDREEKVKQALDLTRDFVDLDLQLKKVPAIRTTPSVNILGMELVDLNKQLVDLYDLRLQRGVLVLDPGKDNARLKIRDLAKGDCFFFVGDTQVSSVDTMVDSLLRNVERREDGSGTCSVSFTFRRVHAAGTSTQHLELSANDLKSLTHLNRPEDSPE